MTVDAFTIGTALGREPADVAEANQWTMWIDDALMLIDARLGDVAELDPAKVSYVVREAVVAHIRHPDDATQVQVSIDDASMSRSYRSGTGRVTIRREWWELLSPEDGAKAAFSIDTVGCASVHLAWCDLLLGGADCSCGALLAGYPIYELY